MGVNWAAGLIRWRPHVSADGRTHSLAHLHPFRFTCDVQSTNSSARVITINVGFALHVFTSEFATRSRRLRSIGTTANIACSITSDTTRRYILPRLCAGSRRESASSPRTITSSPVELACAPVDHEYRVFFNVRPDKANADSVTLIVQSAYFGQRQLSPKDVRRKQVRFRVILLNALLGKPPREPPR
jgi:hypothetical protein